VEDFERLRFILIQPAKGSVRAKPLKKKNVTEESRCEGSKTREANKEPTSAKRGSEPHVRPFSVFLSEPKSLAVGKFRLARVDGFFTRWFAFCVEDGPSETGPTGASGRPAAWVWTLPIGPREPGSL